MQRIFLTVLLIFTLLTLSTSAQHEAQCAEDDWECNMMLERIDDIRESGQTSVEFWDNAASIPAEFWDLEQIEYLNFYSAGSEIHFPPEIAKLTNLKGIGISEMSHHGLVDAVSFPPEIVGLPNLETIAVSSVGVTFPDNIGESTSLKHVRLDSYALVTYAPELDLPASFWDLPNLETLSIRRKLMDDLPAEIGNLQNLRSLSLIQLEMTSLPDEIGQLNNLEELYLAWMPLSNLPDEIGDLNNLTIVQFYNIALHRLPETISGWQNLEDFSVSDVPLEELPTSVGQWYNLRRMIWHPDTNLYYGIDASGNLPPIAQSLPAEIENWTLLEELYIDVRGLEPLPVGIGDLTNLRILKFYSSIESVTFDLSNLTNLEELELRGISELPPNIGQLSNLRELILSTNLETLPPEIGNLQNLEILNLSGNFVITALPPEIGQLTNLQELYIRVGYVPDDVVTMTLPPEIGNLTNLRILDLSNKQVDTIPVEILNLNNLEDLDLDVVVVDARFPDDFGTWEVERQLDFLRGLG